MKYEDNNEKCDECVGYGQVDLKTQQQCCPCNGTGIKNKLIPMKLDAVKVMQDPESGEFFYGICYECDKMLNEEEASYGHDCEG